MVRIDEPKAHTVTGPPDELQRLPGYPIIESFRALRHAMDDALREVGLTTPQWGTLACLGSAGSLSGADMARIHHLTPQTMHTILLNLEAAGLVVRDRDPEHGTVLRVRLTSAGRERLDQAMERVHMVQQRLVADLDESEQSILRELLHRCAASVQGVDTSPSGDMCID